MNKKYLKIIIVIVILLIILLIPFGIKEVKKNNLEENVTTTLKTDEDFLNWFIDFDKLYNKKVKKPYYTLTKEPFELIKKLLNNEDTQNVTYYDNKYIINNDINLELDVNTRSLRYTKYKDKNIIEIMEIRLKNGIYYVQLAKKNELYKISFNNESSKKKKTKIETVKIKNSIFSTKELKW